MSEPTITLKLTRAQVVALLVDAHREKYPTPDSSNDTAAFYADIKAWYLDNPATAATSYWAQVRDNHEGAGWRTVRTSDESTHDAAWGVMTDDMQRRGIRYSELADHIADLDKGAELTAEDGTRYRVLKPGQEITK